MVLKNDLRYIKAERAFKQALLELLGEMPKERITVSKICERALCSRTAFYAHFRDKEELYSAIVKDFMGNLDEVERRYEAHSDNPLNDQEWSIDFFDTWMRHKDVLRSLLNGDPAVLSHELTSLLTEMYMTHARAISPNGQINPNYRRIAAYGAGANIAFMIDCLVQPDTDLDAARDIYVKLQVPINEVASQMLLTSIKRM